MKSGDSPHPSATVAPVHRAKPAHARRDGWTAERQLAFLDALIHSRNIATAASAAGMSRESAYRLCARRDGALFGALWDRAMRPPARIGGESHSRPLRDGQLMRLLGNHYRRESGGFWLLRESEEIFVPPVERQLCDL